MSRLFRRLKAFMWRLPHSKWRLTISAGCIYAFVMYLHIRQNGSIDDEKVSLDFYRDSIRSSASPLQPLESPQRGAENLARKEPLMEDAETEQHHFTSHTSDHGLNEDFTKTLVNRRRTRYDQEYDTEDRDKKFNHFDELDSDDAATTPYEESIPVNHETLPTSGYPWPLPRRMKTSLQTYVLSDVKFKFTVTGKSCSILQLAIQRYHSIIFGARVSAEGREHDRFGGGLGEQQGLKITLSKPCSDQSFPVLKSDESYSIHVSDTASVLKAKEVWGALRGLETFSQLIYTNRKNKLTINATHIRDNPRYSHRGLMLDTARHFIPKRDILTTLDAMSYNKLNVFHWHMVDDQSFPYESMKFSFLSESGAYAADMVYNHSDIKEILEYARLRGIRVIPEFDTPGHTRSWGLSLPELLTECGEVRENINPILRTTYTFLRQLFRELTSLFPDGYFHLGADEVPTNCWRENDEINAFVKNHFQVNNNRTISAFQPVTSYDLLTQFYLKRLSDMLQNQMRKNVIMWQDPFEKYVDDILYVRDTGDTNYNGNQFMPNSTIQVWKQNYAEYLGTFLNLGYDVIFSACWYLNYVSYGSDWTKFYFCDPDDSIGQGGGLLGGNRKASGKPKRGKMIGGEACLWSEYVDSTNLHQTLWPRASGVAEKLWSSPDATSIDNYFFISSRLAEQRCRMLRRGIQASPNLGSGPSCKGSMKIKTYDSVRKLEDDTGSMGG